MMKTAETSSNIQVNTGSYIFNKEKTFDLLPQCTLKANFQPIKTANYELFLVLN